MQKIMLKLSDQLLSEREKNRWQGMKLSHSALTTIKFIFRFFFLQKVFGIASAGWSFIAFQANSVQKNVKFNGCSSWMWTQGISDFFVRFRQY